MAYHPRPKLHVSVYHSLDTQRPLVCLSRLVHMLPIVAIRRRSPITPRQPERTDDRDSDGVHARCDQSVRIARGAGFIQHVGRHGRNESAQQALDGFVIDLVVSKTAFLGHCPGFLTIGWRSTWVYIEEQKNGILLLRE